MAQSIFTDAIKDVIGDEPVLDQFDIDYGASFYHTMQDDYVTGSMLSYAVDPSGRRYFVSGSRGRVFSKYYAADQHPPDATYGSVEVTNNPWQSFREVPWVERTSNVYRILQCFDESERIYDTCLPNIPYCFSQNSSSCIWSATSGSGVDLEHWLSPYKNVPTTGSGFVMFNSLPTQVRVGGADSIVNNDWTWSYPYETKYRPEERYLRTSNALGVGVLKTTAVIRSSSIPFTANIDPKPKTISSVIPILPGFLPPTVLGSNGRNSLRVGRTMLTSSAGDGYGHSWLIPSDVDLTKQGALGAHDTVTGSMLFSDTVKVLFGFGDLNNMTYGEWTGEPNWTPVVSGSKLGANNYPEFHAYKIDPRANPDFSGTPDEIADTAQRYQGYVFGLAPKIRGWKYGMYSGLPSHTRAVFRRERYGQLRDMLEQRIYTKFIVDNSSPFNGVATAQINSSIASLPGSVGPSPVTVNFVIQRYRKDDRGIGEIFVESVSPDRTTSQNLSTEATSSLPYLDGHARSRQEAGINVNQSAQVVKISFDLNKNLKLT